MPKQTTTVQIEMKLVGPTKRYYKYEVSAPGCGSFYVPLEQYPNGAPETLTVPLPH